MCCLLTTLPTRSMGMLLLRSWLASCRQPIGSNVLRLRTKSWTRSVMLLPGIATPSCSSSSMSFQSTIFLSRAVNTCLHMQRFWHSSNHFVSTVVFFLRIFFVHDFLLAQYNNPRRHVAFGQSLFPKTLKFWNKLHNETNESSTTVQLKNVTMSFVRPSVRPSVVFRACGIC